MNHFLIQFSGIRKEESLSLWVEGGLVMCGIVNHEIFLGKAVGKVLSQEREYMVPGMNPGEKKSVFQFLKPQESQQVMGFVAGASGKPEYPVYIGSPR